MFQNAKDRYSVNSSRFSSSLANDDDVFYISFPARARANERRSEYSEWTTDNATTKQSRKKVRNWKAERPDLSISDDPSSYIQAREKLKTAVLEHYRLVMKIFMCTSHDIDFSDLTSDF